MKYIYALLITLASSLIAMVVVSLAWALNLVYASWIFPNDIKEAAIGGTLFMVLTGLMIVMLLFPDSDAEAEENNKKEG